MPVRRATARQVARKRYLNRRAIALTRQRIYDAIGAGPRRWSSGIRSMWYNDLVLSVPQIETLTIFLHYNGVSASLVYRYFDMAYGFSTAQKRLVLLILNAMQFRHLNRRVYDVDERGYVNC